MKKMLRDKPESLFFGLLLFAGHGMIKEGVQAFVLNQFDPNIGFYKLIKIELNIRYTSNELKNAYLVAIFACCREIYRKTIHCSCVGAEDVAEAQKKFDEHK